MAPPEGEIGPDDVPKPSASKMRMSPIDKGPDDIPEPSTSKMHFSPVEQAEDLTRELANGIPEPTKPKKRVPPKKHAIAPVGKGPDDVPALSKPKMRNSPVWKSEDAPWEYPSSPTESTAIDHVAAAKPLPEGDNDSTTGQPPTKEDTDPINESPQRLQVDNPHPQPLQDDSPHLDHHPSLTNSVIDKSGAPPIPHLPPPETHTTPPEPTKPQTFTATNTADLKQSQQNHELDVGKLSLALPPATDAPPSFTITLRIEVSIAPSSG